MTSQTDTILNVSDLTVRFGGLTAINKVSINVQKGDFLGIIGPNGAGKTTLFNVITGNQIPNEGVVDFEGSSLIRKDPAQISHLGISRTFQNIRIFPRMTVLENVCLPLHSKPTYGIFTAMLGLPVTKRRDRAVQDEAMGFLRELTIDQYAAYQAGELSYGLQRRLEIARALAAKPRLLLLDEPAAGMNNKECDELGTLLSSLHIKYGLTIILIEHHVDVVMDLCNRIYVLNLGEVLTQGSAQEIQSSPEVIRAYLGERRDKVQS